ncbi:hypothetical protein [Deinococcus sp. AJ005]|uniref:hypothetical protein n=1 Tax=Deinococcus sp. AJ005 TaxID=2652443 RepID=UPI00125CA9C0|nr:hypothetical protein [Deinococcus sp. AJ005]QFP76809.1 hypothetical protein DAAJ005_10340 [Deinococcus sp. AJ005]
MKKNMLSAAFSLSLILAPAVLTTAFAAPTTVQVTASDSTGDLSYPALYTESSWMSLAVPLADLGGSIPSDLSLDAGTLAAGTTITLDGVTQTGDTALLHVTVSRADTGVSIDQMVTINVMSGGQTVATLSIPVIGAASSD